jgi:hypothetical protein
MLAEQVCVICKKKKTLYWWKCCAEHCTEDGPDVLCLECKEERHPMCGAMNAGGWGIQDTCNWAQGHEGTHTWETEHVDQPIDPALGPTRGSAKADELAKEHVQNPYTRIRVE